MAYASAAVEIERMSAIVRLCFDRCTAVSRFGTAMAAMIPTTKMMANTATTRTITIGAPDLAGWTGTPGWATGAPLGGLLQRGQIGCPSTTSVPQYAQ